jgi:integrase
MSAPFQLPENPATRSVCALFLERASGDVCERMRWHRKQVLGEFCAEYGDVPVSQLRPYHLKLWAEARPNLHSGYSVRSWIAAVKACFGWACSLGIVDRNPFTRVTSKPGKRGRPLTDAEFQAMLRFTDAPMRRFLIFLRFTGCRPGEAAAATWKDINAKQLALVLAKHKTAKKTGKPRVIYLHPVAIRLLAWIRRNQPTPLDALIFVNRWGKSWKNSTRAQRMKRIRELAGLPKDARYYGCRHAFATRAILNGVEIKTLAELMGHSCVSTTEVYTHVAGNHDHLHDAVSRAFEK